MSSGYEPRLTESLKASYIIREGQPVKLSCRFDASPDVEIVWLKDGVPIDFEALGISRDFKVVKEVDYTALLIKEAFPEDTGSYIVVIRNSFGEASSLTQLSVEEFFCRTPESEMSDTPCKPVFVQPLRDITLNEGEKLKLNAAINAHPEPEIIWYCNNVPLKSSRDLTITFDGQLCKLIKDRCEKENDAGIYRITAVNSMGQAESVCQVNIQPYGIQTFRERIQSVRSLPVFVQPLHDEMCHEGKRLLLRVQASGQPKPQVNWYKDNQPIKNANNYKMHNENDIYTLEIPKLSVNHTGIYQARALNSEGESKCSANVYVQPMNVIPEPMIVEPSGRSPEFLQVFADQHVSIGSTVRMEARITGTKPINVYWLFNGLQIDRLGNKQRYQQSAMHDTYTLTIPNVRHEDIGKYCLNAENAWGKATCTAELFVAAPVPKILGSSSSSSVSRVQMMAATSNAANSDNINRGTGTKKNVLSDVSTVTLSSPLVWNGRQCEHYRWQSTMNKQSLEQESSVIYSSEINNSNNRQCYQTATPSLTHVNDVHPVQQHSKKLAIFQPVESDDRRHPMILQKCEIEAEKNHRTLSEDARYGCEKPRRDKHCETSSEMYRRDQSTLTNQYRDKIFDQTNTGSTYHRSLSENSLYKHLRPLTVTNSTSNDDNFKTLESTRTHVQHLVKPIYIHSPKNAIPGETSTKYVRANHTPLEVVLPKPQLKQIQSEHSSTVVKDVRPTARKITANIHQPIRRRTVEGRHEFHIIEKPISSGQTDPIEFTFQKPHEISPLKKSTSEKSIHLSILNIQPRPIHNSDDYKSRDISSSLLLNCHSTPDIQSIHYAPTTIQNPTSPFGNMNAKLSDEYQFHSIKKIVHSSSKPKVDFVVPKLMLDHSKTFIKHTQSKQSIADINETSITETTADNIELLIEKPKLTSEHRTTIIKKQHDKSSLVSTDQTQPITGQHGVTYIKQTRAKYEPVDLVIERPRLLPSISKLVADIPALPKILSLKSTEIVPPEDNSTRIDIDLTDTNCDREFGEMELILEKPIIRDSSTTVIAKVESELELKSVQSKIINEHCSQLVHQQNIDENSSVLKSSIEKSALEAPHSHLNMELNRDEQIQFCEIVMPPVESGDSSTHIIFAQLPSTPTNEHTSVDLPNATSNSSFEPSQPLQNKPPITETNASQRNLQFNDIQHDMSTIAYDFDSSTSLLTNVKTPINTQSIETHANLNQSSTEHSLIISVDMQHQQNQPSDIEIILSHPLIQESTSIIVADRHPTLDVSHKQTTILSPIETSLITNRQIIFEQETRATSPLTSTTHAHPTNSDDLHLNNNDSPSILDMDTQQEQQQYDASMIQANLNKPVEFVFNVDGGSVSALSKQFQGDHLNHFANGVDASSKLSKELTGHQFKPVEFLVSGGVPEGNTVVEQYSTSDGDGTYTTTTTTTKRTIASSGGGGYTQTTNRSVVHGIRPYDQVDLVLQPTSSASSMSKVLTTKVGLDSNHAPYFVLSLHDQTAKEGESVLFEVIVSAQPSAEIVWDKDGKLIGDDSAFRIDYYGDGRATLYIPEAFFDDQGYYTCTATNSLGTCRSRARLTVDSSGPAPKRRQYQSYEYYSKPTTITRVTEETRVYQTPAQHKHNDITYTIQGAQPKFQPVSFLVSTTQENQQPITTATVTDDDYQAMIVSPYQSFSSEVHTRPYQSVKPSYTEQSQTTTTTTTYGQQQQQQQQQPPRSTGLVATVAKQPGPSLTQYRQTISERSEPMQTGSDISTQYVTRSLQSTAGNTYITTRPNFTKPLEPIDAIEGGTIQITVHLTSFGPNQVRPNIQWFHHGQPIVGDGGHYRIIDGYDTSTLEIVNITRVDTGQVMCVANTTAGSATTTCDITVQENPVRTYHQLIPLQHVVPQETVHTTQLSHLSHTQIPLHQPQLDQHVPTHYYSKQTITPHLYGSQSYSSVSSQQSHLVQPQQVPQTQATAQAFVPPAPPLLANFGVRPQYSDQQVKIIGTGLQDGPLYLGADTVFECQFSGQPDKIQWFHNDIEIPYNPHQLTSRVYHITNMANGTSRLVIRSTTNDDIGTYTIKITGPNGDVTSSAKLMLPAQYHTLQNKKTELTQRKALVQELEEKQIKRMRPSSTAAPRGSFTSYATSDDDVFFDVTQRTAAAAAPFRQPSAPIVSRPLKEVTVNEGQPIQITCQIQGFPKSELLWFKNNVPLPLSARHKIAYEAGTGNITLRINESRPEDSGVYTVIAKNPQGHAQTSAFVDVQAVPAIDETSYVEPDAFKYIEKQTVTQHMTKPRRESDTAYLNQKPAKIIRTPLSTSVVEGATALFTCQVEGNPKPQIAWLKDNKPLMSGARFTTYFDQPSKTAVLRINDVSKDDQGYYTCIVDNTLNSDRSTATLQVIPEMRIDQRSYVETDAFKYLTPENKQRLVSNKDVSSGVDSESYVDLESFRYLEAKKPKKEVDASLTIDDRPMVDLDAFRYLEARQASIMQKDNDLRASIDDTPIITPEAFRYLERKFEVSKTKKDTDTGPLVDETPQVNLAAFQYLERKDLPKKVEETGPSIDVSSIVNPEAFKFLERKPVKKTNDLGPSIDETPLVNPDAFRYLERQAVPHPRDTTPMVDTTSIINPEVFKYLEKTAEPRRTNEGPLVDTRPIVPQEAFRWLERPQAIERQPAGPAVDESSYVDMKAFRYIEAKPKPKVVDNEPAVDESSYVNPQAFRFLEAPTSKKRVDDGPAIDTSTFVNPEVFARFERKAIPKKAFEEEEHYRTPRVIQPLKSTQAQEGKPTVLVAVVDGYPVPQLTWLKNGSELPASNRVTTNYDIPSKTAWIRIDSARPDDSAVYTLIGHNPAGDVRSDARLTVIPSTVPVDDTAFVPAEAFARIEQAAAQTRSKHPVTTGVDDTSFINPELFLQFEAPLKRAHAEKYADEVVVQVPARITVPLKSIKAPENVTVVLEAVVDGSPIPTFTWLKNQAPLSESNRFITNYDIPTKRITLTIKDVRESDTGVYTLLATNGPELQHSTATLHVMGAPSIDQSSFVPMNVFAQLEQPLNQSRQIPVQAGVDQTSYISQPDRFAAFDLKQAYRRPMNEFGGVDETPLINLEKIRLLEIPSVQAKQPYDIEEILQAPSVLSPLQSINTEEGNPVVLTAKITGSPMPNFTWFKDNAPLVASSRFTTYYDISSKVIMLQINDARPNDSGVYTIRADNKSGDVSTSATLNVASLPSVRDQSFIPSDRFNRLEQPYQPRFINEVSGVDDRPLVDLTKLRQLEIKPTKTAEEEPTEQIKATVLIPLRNVHAVENQPVVLSAQVDGKPQPLFTWFKDNKPLPEGNRFRTHYDIPSKTIFLTIAGARGDDSGIYRLVAKNPTGQEETSCQVTVELNQPNVDRRSFVPQSAFDKLEKPILKPSDIISGVDQSSFFNQELFRPFEEYHIKHPSAIVGGVDDDAVMPVSAPRILTPLRPITTTEGNTIMLITQVEGYPLPQFAWIHNGSPLMASNRATSHYDMLTKRCYLQIFDTRPNDAGTYELIAQNPAGEDRTKTEVTILPVSKIDQTGYVPFEKFSSLEFKPRIPSDLRSGVDSTPFVSGEIFRLLETKPVNQQYAPEDDRNVPLEILVPLKLAVAQEGQPVILTTKIRGRPMPQFTWLRNNQPIMESNRFQTHYDFPSETLVLEISDIWPHDSGTYTVIATNPKTGERAETSAPLVVRSDSGPVDSTAFISPDAFKTLETQPNLRTVIVEPGVDTNSFLPPHVLRVLEQTKPKPMDVDEKEQPRTPPKVVLPLKPVQCNEGQPINFTARVEGNPLPTFTWYKNNQPLQESNRFWSHYDVPTKTVLLQVNGARPDDSGTYTLLAKNPLGQDQTNANVNVTFAPGVDTNAFVSPDKFAAFDRPTGPRAPLQGGVDTSPFVQPERFAQLELKAPLPTKEEMEHMEPPKVIIPLQSVQMNEGSPVLLQATIIGKPTPNFVWLKDNNPLMASNRLRTRYDIATKQVLLQINDIRPQDVGEYVVIAKNPAGEDSTICALSVVPDKPGVDDRAFVPQDKFRDLEHPLNKGRRPLEIVPGVDVQPFVSPDKFHKLEHVPSTGKPEQEITEPARPPKVIVPLSNCELEELMPVIFTTTIDAGVPMASFTWFKNGQPLYEGNRYTTKYDIYTKVLTLQILAARPDDQGTYTVRATNPSGSDETTCKLTIRPIASIDTRPFVQPEMFAQLELKAPPPTKEDLEKMEPPKVIVPLKRVQVKESSPVLLQATIVGKPMPNFVWLKDGSPLAASNRLRTRYDIGTKQVLLQINDARPQDVGEYVVIAKNPAGEDSTICSLSILPDKPGVDDRAFVPHDKFRDLEHPEGKGRRPLEIVPGVDVQPFVSPDKFHKLEHVPSTGKPEQEITEPARPPKVIVPLSNCELEELMPVIFTTTIDAGVPMASFTWFKNGQPLYEGNRYTTKYDIYTKVLTLQILAARPDDQGTYTVRATNPSGSDETTCKLTIRPIASIDTRPFIGPDAFAQLELKAPPPTKEDLEKMEPPKVIVPLKSVQVKESSPVLLQATIVGKPTPNFVWLKDGSPLAASNRLRTRYDIGTKQVLLQINDARPQDVGEYVVIAKNPAGEDSTICSLSILPDKPGVDDRAFVPHDKFRDLEHPEGKGRRPLEIVPGVDVQPFVSPDKFHKLEHVPSTGKPEQEITEPARPPKVIVPLSNCELEELMPVIFTTTIDAGVPMASFTWFKNGQPLYEGNRYTTKYDIYTKVLTLQILAARPDDQGTYTVRATNPSGSDETTCKLTIRPIASIDTRPFIGPDAFAQLELKAPPPTKEDLEQMQPPKVIVPLPSLTVKEGSPVLLQATIIGKPTPNFVWLKDGGPLAASNRLRTRYDIGTKQVLLQINDVRPFDLGEYRVIATNPAGQDSTIGSLSILPDKPGVDDRAFVPQDKFRDLEHPEGKGRRPLEIVPGVDVQPFVSPDKFHKLEHVPPMAKPQTEETPEAMRPPKVIVPMKDSDLEELMPVILTATIDAGAPMATFTWFKNGQPLLESNRFTTKYDIVNRIITLQILASRPGDQGTYTVRAINPVGSDETSCKLTIRPVASIDTRPFVDAERFRPLEHRPVTGDNVDDENKLLRPPKVLIPMNHVRLAEFQPIVLKSIIDAGYPMGKFTWFKENRPLPESNRYSANYDINTRTASLIINSARPTTDTGRYTVHVENIVGKDQTTGSVQVDGTPSVDERPFIEPSKFGKFDGPLRKPILQPEDLLKDRENVTPWIRLVTELEDQVINETKAAQLICSIDSFPAATINWFKDEQPLVVSQRFIPEYDFKTGVVRLTIYPVYVADTGKYKMVARNVAGEVSTQCTLKIQPTANVEDHPLVKFAGLRKTPQQPAGLQSEPSQRPLDAIDGQKPYFIKVPVDQEVPEGQLVRLDYIPAGRPEPSLTWYRNGEPLRPDDADHCDVINEGGVHSLLVRNPKLGPPVEYKCVAKNKYGEASFIVHLNVVERGANIAPYFIELLYDIIIIEGHDARLDACAQGFPEPKITWEKEGQPLTPNKEYKVEFEGTKTTLYIHEAKMTDAGWYQCTAISLAGTAVTKCRVTVIPLSQAEQYAKALPPVGPQLAKLPTLPEEDPRSKYMTIPPKPPEVKPEELYKLPKRTKKTENPAEEAKKRGVRVLPDEVLAALQKDLEEIPEEEMYSKDRPQPPKFKVHIKSQLNLNEDDPCIFEAKLIPVRDPMMRVQWFKNGKILHHASRIIPRYDFADVSLEFLWTFAEDNGIYECVATNPYGEDRTRCELKCRPKRSIIYNTQLPEGMAGVSKLQMLEDEIRYTSSMIGLEEKVQEKEPKAPEFIMPLADLTADEGDNAKFIAKVDGHPRPRVTWTINNSDIVNGSRYKLVYDGLVHYLEIPRTRQYDAGTICCTAKNAHGQADSVATLTLIFRQDYRSALSKTPGGISTGADDSFDVDIEERLRLRSQNRQKDAADERLRRPSAERLHPLQSKVADRMSWRQTAEKAGEAPNFTKSLLPLKANEGSKVVVSVEFTGDPAPTVSWYRDGFMVEDSEDFKIITTPTQSTLTIKHAFIIDSGLYTVKLFNPIGIRQCQAAIRITPIIAEDQTPRFLDVPHDTEILAGDPVRFQCRVEGEPFPTVVFYREDEPVNLSDKRFRAIQEGDVFTLLLFEALPADSGQYEAVAENTVGKANTRFTLIVTPRGPDGKKASITDDPKLIHKVPYLEKPLQDLHVKEGQSATFECIIPASFGSDVKWYKGTSEFSIKPSKFFKPKSDGTKHQLFILEAYPEDAGLYKCVVSNPVGTTATTATLKVDHAMQVPEFVRGFSNITTYEGEQVRFDVEVRGDPIPSISWYRDGELIRDSPDFQIFTEGTRSVFFISEVFMEDQGLFTCTASNAAGSSECSARLIVEPRPQL